MTLCLPRRLVDVPGAAAATFAAAPVPRVSAWHRLAVAEGGGVRVRLHMGVGMPASAEGRPHPGFSGALTPGAPVLVPGAGAACRPAQRAASGGGGAAAPAGGFCAA